MTGEVERIEAFFRQLHQTILDGFEAEEGGEKFLVDEWTRPVGHTGLTGTGLTCVLEQGQVFERAGCNFSDVRGDALPPAATVRHPHLAGTAYRAMGVSVVAHPRNPHVPTAHLNVRSFTSGETWWFGGGFDLTPYYPVEEDVRAWHRAAHDACEPFAPGSYATYKKGCDEYFYLKHRHETRGVGGIFLDDLTGDFEQCFALIQRIGLAFIAAYRPIVQRRKKTPYGERERAFQSYRRGRYVEFNLVFDRGTLFGLQSGGRTEAILVSMPPMASWRYDYQPEPDSPESALAAYLTPRDWLSRSV